MRALVRVFLALGVGLISLLPMLVITPPVVAAATPCLANDPFNLAQLRSIISSPTPTSFATINADILVQFVRSGTMTEDGDDDAGPDTGRRPPQPTTREAPPAQSSFGPQQVRIFNTRNGFEYRVTLSDNILKTIWRCHEATGLTSAGGTTDLGKVEPLRALFLPIAFQGSRLTAGIQGWSNGDDSRTLRTPATLWPWRTISQSSAASDNPQESRCTFTLIGPRHFISAAHCIVNQGTSSWKTRQLTPGRDGLATSPYGSTSMTTNPPAGVEAWYLVPDQWTDPATSTDDAWQWDWGLVLAIDRIGDSTGWMGYVAMTGSDLGKQQILNRGYPSCKASYSEKPAGCQTARLYGDTADCVIGGYYDPGSNGWNRRISFSCDISRGHSGSALYFYFFDSKIGQTVPVVTAMVSTQSCTTCSSGDAYPNKARRVTPYVLGKISWLRETFP